MTSATRDGRKDERGSALVIAVLVTAILTLLGISYLLMADTENKIAQNERLSAQALYFGEGVVREVKRWFDRPPYGVLGGRNLVKPTTADIDRTLRKIDTDGDGPTAPFAADGSPGAPYYKDGIDLNADGHDDIFDKPYRSDLKNTFLGTEDGPDVRISRAAGGNQAALLDALADKIAPNFPAPNGALRARIDQIDIYEPPYIEIGTNWTRYGMATVKATVSIVKTTGTAAQTVATKIVKAVLNETPYPGPYGPLQSCEELIWNGEFRVHWGTSTAVGPDGTGADVSFPNNWDNKLYKSIPRATPPTPKLDLLYGYNDNTIWANLKAGLQGKSIQDPWFQFFSGADIEPFKSIGGFGSPQLIAPGTTDEDHSNLFRNMPGVGCPEFDYDTWKQIAQSGGSDTHYYAWDNGTNFRENGSGAAQDFTTLVDNRTGFFFFDTTDGIAPHDPDASGVAANLTPAIQLGGSTFGVRGFVYMNTRLWTSNGTVGRAVTMHWPAEPYRDVNENGSKDPGEDWINLNYSSISTTDPHVAAVVDSADAYGGGTVWNSRGPDITGQRALIWGLLYISGEFDAQGTPLYYGSVVTKAGMNGSMAGTPDLFWDTDLKDNWPPPTWELPRVIITKWQTDL